MTQQVTCFAARDGIALNVIDVRGRKAPAKVPVLLVHGAGVRANIFRAPSGRTTVDALIDTGHDVWLENWRASIDVPHNHWTLDQAAVLDHPVAVQTVARETGTDAIKAVIAGRIAARRPAASPPAPPAVSPPAPGVCRAAIGGRLPCDTPPGGRSAAARIRHTIAADSLRCVAVT